MTQVLESGSAKTARRIDTAKLEALVTGIQAPPGDAANRVREFFLRDLAILTRDLDAIARKFSGPGLQDSGPRAEFAALMDGIIARGETAVRGLDKAATQRVKHAFRLALGPWTADNPFMERCLKKPQGYAGDFAMMEVGYLRWTGMGGGLAGAFDRYFADTYDNVRQRKIKLMDNIRPYLVDRTRQGVALRMLSLGSGPCREWVDLDHERRSGGLRDDEVNRTQLIGIDKDPASLDYARRQLQGNSLLQSVEFVEADLFQFTKAERWRGEERSFDFIYGVGIANYFYDAMLQNIISSAFALVKPGGSLLITHKDGESFNFPVADWLCDWVFLKRSEPVFAATYQEALAESKGQYSFRTERIPDRTMFFGIATRTR